MSKTLSLFLIYNTLLRKFLFLTFRKNATYATTIESILGYEI